jgi:hypothetical protein
LQKETGVHAERDQLAYLRDGVSQATRLQLALIVV